MGTFISNILQSKGLDSVPTPLWKLKLTDSEYDALKGALADSYQCYHSFRTCPKEAALFLAEWWKRDSGESLVSGLKNQAFASLGLHDDNRGTGADDLIDNAKRVFDGNDSNYIPGLQLVKTYGGNQANGRRHFEYSLFYQGGFPMGRACSKKGAAWSRLIRKFVKKNIELGDVSGAVIAKKALREYKKFFVSAAREHKPEGMPFVCDENHPWYKLAISEIEEGDRERECRPFSATWHLEKKGGEIHMYCNIQGPFELRSNYLKAHPELLQMDSIPVHLYIGNQYIETLIEYQKSSRNGETCYISHYNINRPVPYSGDEKIFLRIPGINKPVLSTDVDMDIPHSFFLTPYGDYEMGGQIGNTQSIITFKEPWQLVNGSGNYKVMPVTLGGVPYSIVISFISGEEEDVAFLFKNAETGEPQPFDSDSIPQWTEVEPLFHYNNLVVEELFDFSNEDLYRVLRCSSDDEDGVPSKAKDVYFRSSNDQKWEEKIIPFGKVQCSIDKGICSPEKNLFSVGPKFIVESRMQLPQECRYEISWDQGDVFPEGINLQKDERGLWIFTQDIADSPVPFRCVPKSGIPFVIHIKPVYRDFSIFSPSGEKISKNEIIPWSELSSYRYSANGIKTLSIQPFGDSYSVNIGEGGYPNEGQLSLLIDSEILDKYEKRADTGCFFSIRYCMFTLLRYPITIKYDSSSNSFSPCLAIYDNPYAKENGLQASENEMKFVNEFRGHMLCLDMKGQLLHDIQRNDDGAYYLPVIKEKVLVVCNQRGIIRPFYFDNGIISSVTSIETGVNPFEDCSLDSQSWISAEQFLDAGLRYDIALTDLPWISFVLDKPVYVLAFYLRQIIKAKNDPFMLAEARNRMTALMNAGEMKIEDLYNGNPLDYIESICTLGQFAEQFTYWCNAYSLDPTRPTAWDHYLISSLGKVEQLIKL